MIDLSTAFQIANLSIIPFWLLLIVAPRWQGTNVLVHSMLYPLAIGVVYSVFALGGSFFAPNAPEGGGFGSLEELAILFSSPPALFAGWIHYLVFDLFVGAWEARDAQKRGVPHLLLIPCLILTCLLGPMGLLVYLVMRLILRKGGWRLDPEE